LFKRTPELIHYAVSNILSWYIKWSIIFLKVISIIFLKVITWQAGKIIVKWQQYI
jgi:hypothetical protein